MSYKDNSASFKCSEIQIKHPNFLLKLVAIVNVKLVLLFYKFSDVFN